MFDLPAAWTTAHRLYRSLVARFGPWRALLDERLTKRARRTLDALLTAAETALRHLLLLEALKLPRTPKQPRPAPPPRAHNNAPPARDIPDHAVLVEAAPSFRLAPPPLFGYAREDDAPPRTCTPRKSNPTRALARRLAALAAVFDDLDLYVRRMAERLAEEITLGTRITLFAPDPAYAPPTFSAALNAAAIAALRAPPAHPDSS